MIDSREKGNEKINSQAAVDGKSKGHAPSGSFASEGQIPTISLPKGGGAIKGIDEKFAVNAVNGTSSLSIPLPLSQSRSNFAPLLALSYNSGAGNSVFGLGWNLEIPTIQRKTDKQLPQYRDENESDVFMFSGAEDLVPVLNVNKYKASEGIRVKGYRPRVEGIFAKIEKIIIQEEKGFYWKVTTKDNVVTFFGKSSKTRICDPNDDTKIFKWLPELSYDDKGNCIEYEYVAEDLENVPIVVHEKNRHNKLVSVTNKYLKKVKYGNKTPYYPLPTNPYDPFNPENHEYFFEVVFDYDDHDQSEPLPVWQKKWGCRKDSFSDNRAGFEIRTYRLCRRILFFHYFKELSNGLDIKPCLVRSLNLNYKRFCNGTADSLASHGVETDFITSIQQLWYRKTKSGSYKGKGLPAMEFQYNELDWNKEIKNIDCKDMSNAPVEISNQYQWVDFYNEGISGILTEQAEAWHYKSNLGNGSFSTAMLVAPKPSLNGITNGSLQIQDLDANGKKYIVSTNTALKGYYGQTDDGNWEPFRYFRQMPNINFRDPNVRFIDLNGDGRADLIISEDEVFTWYPSQGTQGFGGPEYSRKPFDEEQGPYIIFADSTQSIFLADMNGDGLTDIVRIRNGEICYWPNMGYGNFGAKVNMSHAPLFDTPDAFNPVYLHLADISGTGATDILYLGQNKFKAWINLSGNAWSEPQAIEPFCPTEFPNQLSVIDLLGHGTPCIVWSSPLPQYTDAPMRYIDLMGGKKPFVMSGYKNNLGKETRIKYKSSTYYYLNDKQAGKPWVTKLPFSVQVVEQVETYDRISQNRFVTRYAYHHGYYDGPEREFRGFGLVEQWDTEEFAVLCEDGVVLPVTNFDAASHVPPVYTKTWFHTGAYFDGTKITRHFATEYYQEPNLTSDQLQVMLLDDTVLPAGLSVKEEREACRALKGSVLRQEVYAQDNTAKSKHPFSVSERNYTVECLEPRASNLHAVFFVHSRETVDYHYERETVKLDKNNPNSSVRADPRVSHQIILKVDEYGSVERTVAIGYPRRAIADRQLEQAETHIMFTVGRFANYTNEQDWYRAGLPVETRTYEIVKPPQPIMTSVLVKLFTFQEMQTLTEGLLPLGHDEPDVTKTWPYEKWDWRKDTNVPKDSKLRLVEHVRILYYKNDLSKPLALGQSDALALVFGTYKLAFTPGVLTTYRREHEDLLSDLMKVMQDEGGYIMSDEYKTLAWFPSSDANGYWWIPSGQQYYSPIPDSVAAPIVQNAQYAKEHFYLPQAMQDQFGAITRIEYDEYDLMLKKIVDSVGNIVTVETQDTDGHDIIAIDYRLLQPWLITDPNGNRTEVAFDLQGLVVGTAVMGKIGENKGDSLAGFKADLEQSEIDSFFANPKGPIAATLLGSATTRIVYDVTRYARLQTTGKPVFAAALARETHASDQLSPNGLKIQVGFSYSDGFGREIQKKIPAEAGSVEECGTVVNERWVGSGWTIFNNKGKPVKQYEPFFTFTHDFEFAKQHGVSSTLFYDPLGRVVATLHSNHTYAKVVFDPWRQETWDVNDTVLQADPQNDPDVGNFFRRLPDAEYLPTWHESRQNGQQGAAEQSAAQKAAAHANTLAVADLDTLGRAFLTIADNGSAGKYETRVELDIEGNLQAVIDDKKRAVMRYEYDMLGNNIKQVSMDAGTCRMLADATGKPLRSWDGRNHEFSYKYDVSHRPLEMRIKGGDGPVLLDNVYVKIIYGEGRSLNGKTDQELNLRGQPFAHYDTGGKIQFEEYDFKGNLIRSHRRLAKDYKQVVQWVVADPNSELEDEIFVTETEYDALNRVIRFKMPDGSIIEPAFNEANLLEKVHVEQGGTGTDFVTDINYDAKGQRNNITYGNGIKTTYQYDRETFRLTHLDTKKANGELLQDLYYTFDPIGNITQIEDQARPTVFFNNFETKPVNQFTYDALYRLIEATGREHIAQVDFGDEDNWNDLPFLRKYNVNDSMAWQNYTQQYQYDAVGNVLQMKHSANGGSWTRNYEYETVNNRLKSTTVGTITYYYSHHLQHGFMEAMPHLQLMQWNFQEELQAVVRQRRTDGGTPETTYYVYDAVGQRIRKVTENAAGAGNIPTKKNERIYVGGIEIYREYTGIHAGLERKTLHVMDNTRRIAMVEIRNDVDDGSPVRLVRYQFGNHLDTACLETDDSARVISYEEYHPYGTTSHQAMDKKIKAAAKLYSYTGKERDEETGLYYYGARYYAPWLGRWTSADPARMVDGVNLFAFTQGNPLRRIDINGCTGEEVVDKFDLGDEVCVRTYVWDDTASESGYWDYCEPKLESTLKKNPTAPKNKPSPHADASPASTPTVPPASTSAAPQPSTDAPKNKSTEMDYATALVGKLFDPRFWVSVNDKKGVSGGIPGGKGPEWMANPVGQAVYIGINLFCTFASGIVESGLRKGVSAMRSTLSAAWSRLRPTVLQAATAPAFLLMGVGGGGGGMLPKKFFSKSPVPLTAAEERGAQAALDVARQGGSPQMAGQAGHEAAGANPRGFDFPEVPSDLAYKADRPAVPSMNELKFHLGGPMFESQFNQAATQVTNYSLQQQLRTLQELGYSLVPITSTTHVYIDIRRGVFIKYVGR
ncbi:SpvB/TcaC N-terminal domain-containing protein [Desulfosporosinus sp. BG]|uniref:SpvB/TcaC N-terminal domain-containing protein n=1 Tax=Desulfosporosinus sp. BG TaxID=1633135 RepID=UPI00083ABA22|nr:SpvB/TcaC N-terminal domain-containing protein [Desulfosporosinus sp. BG]ODA39376.1 insecticidal toxin complex protein [Desulfosporosinus sp. BG]